MSSFEMHPFNSARPRGSQPISTKNKGNLATFHLKRLMSVTTAVGTSRHGLDQLPQTRSALKSKCTRLTARAHPRTTPNGLKTKISLNCWKVQLWDSSSIGKTVSPEKKLHHFILLLHWGLKSRAASKLRASSCLLVKTGTSCKMRFHIILLSREAYKKRTYHLQKSSNKALSKPKAHSKVSHWRPSALLSERLLNLRQL